MRVDMYDGFKISEVVEVNRTPQLLPHMTSHSIDFNQRCLTAGLYSLHVSLLLKKQNSQYEKPEADQGFLPGCKR